MCARRSKTGRRAETAPLSLITETGVPRLIRCWICLAALYFWLPFSFVTHWIVIAGNRDDVARKQQPCPAGVESPVQTKFQNLPS